MVRSMLTEEEKAEIWRRYQRGASLRSIHRALGRAGKTVWLFVPTTGGRPPVVPTRSAPHLSMAEREEISRGVVAQESCRAIARRLGRSPSTVSARSPATVGGCDTARLQRTRQPGERPPRPRPGGGAT